MPMHPTRSETDPRRPRPGRARACACAEQDFRERPSVAAGSGVHRRRGSPPRAVLALLLGAAVPIAAQDNGGDGGAPPAGPPPQPVRVADVKRETVADRRLVVGELRAARRVLVAAREPGIVVELPVREGQRVEAGALLAQLDGARLELELAELEADRTVAAATLTERRADAEMRRWMHQAQVELERRGSGQELELREAAWELSVADARALQAERQLELLAARRALLQRRIDDLRVVAPFAGTVVARPVEVGGYVTAGGAVVELVSTGAIEAWFAVPEQHAAAVREPGATIELTAATGFRTRSSDFRIVPDVAPSVRSFPLVVPLDEPDPSLQPGMSARAWVPAGVEAEHLLVPTDAVLRSEIGSYVYVAQGGAGGQPARAMPVPVDILFSDGQRYAVRSAGLAPGARVVVEGNERLHPQALILPTPAQDR